MFLKGLAMETVEDSLKGVVENSLKGVELEFVDDSLESTEVEVFDDSLEDNEVEMVEDLEDEVQFNNIEDHLLDLNKFPSDVDENDREEYSSLESCLLTLFEIRRKLLRWSFRKALLGMELFHHSYSKE
ncbi:hypothetical protein P8452_37171 [Trifolium repens]|nr:hypothetical protein P8452_37171 [Trifolium repens]